MLFILNMSYLCSIFIKRKLALGLLGTRSLVFVYTEWEGNTRTCVETHTVDGDCQAGALRQQLEPAAF